MSESNAEIVRSLYEAFNGRDFAAALARISPEVVIDYRGVLLDTERSYRGHEGMNALTDNILQSVDLTMEVEDLTELGDRVVVAVHQWGPGLASGVPVDRRTGHVWTMREGKAVRLEICRTQEEAWKALEAAGA